METWLGVNVPPPFTARSRLPSRTRKCSAKPRRVRSSSTPARVRGSSGGSSTALLPAVTRAAGGQRHVLDGRPRACGLRGERHEVVDLVRYLASGSRRSWNFTTLLVVPLPPSLWDRARGLTV